MAILLVLFNHFTTHSGVGRLYPGLARVALVGNSGVDFFFVLSGFLITGILLDGRGGAGYFSSFYMRRVLRIVPAYAVTLLLGFGLLPLVGARLHLATRDLVWIRAVSGDGWWYVLYLSNYFIAMTMTYRNEVLDHSWSLAIEEQFYLVWPLVVAVLSREGLMRCCVAVIAGALACRLALLTAGAPLLWTYFLTPCRMDELALGALAAAVLRAPGDGGRRFERVCLGATVLAASVTAALQLAHARPDGFLAHCAASWRYAILGWIGTALILRVLRHPAGALARCLSSRVLGFFGKYSYGLYLYHLFVVILVRNVLIGEHDCTLPLQMAFYLVATAVTVLMAWASWQLLERRCLALKSRFPSAVGPPAAAGPG